MRRNLITGVSAVLVVVSEDQKNLGIVVNDLPAGHVGATLPAIVLQFVRLARGLAVGRVEMCDLRVPRAGISPEEVNAACCGLRRDNWWCGLVNLRMSRSAEEGKRGEDAQQEHSAHR